MGKRYNFCKVDIWRKVLFSDESHFEVYGSKVSHVRRSDKERLSPEDPQQTVKHPHTKCFGAVFYIMS